MNRNPEVVFESYRGSRLHARRFEGFVGEVFASRTDEIVPALKRIESTVNGGLYAAGFISYEAAPGLDASLPTREPSDFPLLWFGFFRECRETEIPGVLPAPDAPTPELLEWRDSLSRSGYCASVERIRAYIAAGDCYQVNFTMRRSCGYSGDERALYRDLCRSQRAAHCAFIDLGRRLVLSVSPELFFRLEKDVLTVRPMKGTAARGRWSGEDEEIARRLRKSDKERAENLMIVDLLRNDLGRISENGSVRVDSLFDVETLETVHQMTSTISSRLRGDVDLLHIFRALFPCGSVTGAPKKRSMEIIAEQEASPRGLYTGCVGHISPGREHAVFSIAIRTLVLDRERGNGELGVGSGITWCSDAGAEHDECLAKGMFALRSFPEFNLIESLLYEEESGYFLLERHLERLRGSARYFGFELDLDAVRNSLEKRSENLSGNRKVRLLLNRDGVFSLTDEPLSGTVNGGTGVIAFAAAAVDSSDHFLYHKTSCRELYLRESAARPDCLDVIFCNERGEVTEGANNNIVIRLDRTLVTPPVESGLLPGVFRGHLLETGAIRERRLTRHELEHAGEIYLINSVRKWRKVRMEG